MVTNLVFAFIVAVCVFNFGCASAPNSSRAPAAETDSKEKPIYSIPNDQAQRIFDLLKAQSDNSVAFFGGVLPFTGSGQYERYKEPEMVKMSGMNLQLKPQTETRRSWTFRSYEAATNFSTITYGSGSNIKEFPLRQIYVFDRSTGFYKNVLDLTAQADADLRSDKHHHMSRSGNKFLVFWRGEPLSRIGNAGGSSGRSYPVAPPAGSGTR